MNNLKSYTEYAVTTSTTDFVIGFDFNYGTDAVNVTVDGVSATEAGYTVVYLNSTTMRLTPAVTSGVVRLQRETDIDAPDNRFTAGAKFIAGNMDENFTQIRQSQQEVRDGFNKLSTDTYAIIDTLQEVGQAAQDAANAAEAAAQTANDAAAQVNDKISYQDLDNAVEVAFAPVTDYIALPFKPGKSYALYERVQLANGDIVKSTVAGNTVNPNVNMAGWSNPGKRVLNLDDFKTGANTDADAFYAMLAYAKAQGSKSLNITRDISINRQITCNLSDVIIDFHGNKFNYIGSGQDNLRFNSFSLSGELTTTKTTLTASSAMGTSKVTVANASNFKVGDAVLLKSTSVIAPLMYINHLCQIISISANTVELDTVFGIDVDTSATVELIKVNPIRNTFIKNVSGFTNVQTTRANGSNFIGFDLAVNCHALNTSTKGFYFKGVYFYRSNSCSYVTGIARDAPTSAGGEGYAMQFDYTVNSLVKGIKAYSMRHLFDATAAWNIDVQDCFDYASPSASFGCHKAFEYDIRFDNCHSILSKGNAFMFGSASAAFGQTVNKISMRNCGVFGSAFSAVTFATLGKGLEVSNTTLNIAGASGQFALICAENDTVISNVTTNAGISIVKPGTGAYTGGKVTVSNNSKIYRNAYTRAIVLDLSTKLTVNNSFISGAVNMKTGSTLNLNNSDWDIDSILFIEAGDKTQFLNVNGGSIKSTFATATTLALNMSKAVFNSVEFSFANVASKIVNTCNDIEINECSGVLSVETTSTVNSIKLTNNPLINNGALPVLAFTGSGITIDSLNVTGNTGAISASNYLMLLNNSGIVATKAIVMGNNTTGRITLGAQSSTKCIATNNICVSPVFPTADGSNKFVSNNITA